jgi:hypothetical protein
MGGWIKLEKDLLTDPRLVRAAMEWEEREGISNGPPLLGVTVLLGALAQLWILADTHIGNDDTLALNVDQINKIIGVKNFCALIPDDWLEVLDGNRVKLPEYHRHNGTIAKESAQNARRQSKHRKRVTVRRYAKQTRRNGGALPDQDQDQDHIKTKDNAPLPGLDLLAWNAWRTYRAEVLKKPIRAGSACAAMNALQKFGDAQMSVVQNSIANGYQGLFAPKPTFNGNGATSARPRIEAAELAELEAHAKAIGFRAKFPLESIGAYRTDLKMFETKPPGFRLADVQKRAQGSVT